MSDRPTSIVGGVRHDPEPMAGQKPLTFRHWVGWTTATGGRRWVCGPTLWCGSLDRDDWRGDSAWRRFVAEIERCMSLNPPV